MTGNEVTYLGIEIDYSRDRLLTDFARKLLADFYMKEGETSPQESFARAATCFCYGDYALAQRIYDYASKQWMSFSSPVLSNSYGGEWITEHLLEGAEAQWPAKYVWIGENGRALPISCFLTYVPDTIDGQIESAAELAHLSIAGGGVGQHYRMRGITDKSPGPIPYLKTSDSNIMYYKQGQTRKGSVAAYLDYNHPSIQEFTNVRVPTGGDINRKCLNVHNAVNVDWSLFEAARSNSLIDLVCPHTGNTSGSVSARELVEDLIETRFRTGEPYLNNLSEANTRAHSSVHTNGMRINGSNLCNEIHLPTDERHTAVCCLSSLNIEYFDEWKDTTIVEDCVRFLDNVIQWFIDNAPPSLEKAVRSAEGFRDLGLGAMGWHSYLQRNMIAFESGGYGSAIQHTHKIFKHIKERSVTASEELAIERGEPSYLLGTGRRNAHLLAVAPNANSSVIANCSPSIEPTAANTYTHRTRVGSFVVRNKYLSKLLNTIYYDLAPNKVDNLQREFWLKEQWKIIDNDNGSIRNLWYLDDNVKEVFKTAFEIDQHWIVEQARVRQEHICQGQSVNLFFEEGVDASYVLSVHLAAFDPNGAGVPLKGLYYLRTRKAKTTERVNVEVKRRALADYESQDNDECLSCQG